jgi:hypothetical protein
MIYTELKQENSALSLQEDGGQNKKSWDIEALFSYSILNSF